MKPDAEEMTRYALVVPGTMLSAAERVRPAVRRILDIDLYVVDEDGAVRTSRPD